MRNPGDSPITLTFRTTQMYDLIIARTMMDGGDGGMGEGGMGGPTEPGGAPGDSTAPVPPEPMPPDSMPGPPDRLIWSWAEGRSFEQVVTTLPVGDYPLGVAFNPTDGNLYVANFNDGTVSVIDGSSNVVIDTISTGRGAQWLAFNPRNSSLYVTNSIDGTVSVISARP